MPVISSSSSSSSSTSSIDSSSSTSNSSSSSHELLYRKIRLGLINQNNHSLIPFTFTGERGTSADLGDDAKIDFIIQASDSAYLDYEAVINRDNNAISSVSVTDELEVYMPEEDETKYKHEASFHVDIVAKDDSGIKEVRTHVEPDKYQFEELENVFFIPRFSWES